MELIEAVNKHAGHITPAIIKWLEKEGLTTWSSLTKSNLMNFRDALTDNVSAGSARTYLATIKSIIGRYEEEVDLPCKNYREILKVKADKTVKMALTPEELERLAGVETRDEVEEYVLKSFIVGSRTGMRHSDIIRTTKENIFGNGLTYVSLKTGIEATLPVSPRTVRYIEDIRARGKELSLMWYNKVLKRLSERAGLTDTIKVHRGGKDIVARKCDLISSHTARISFCTNLHTLGVPLLDISRLAGHTDAKMTERYIVNMGVKLPETAMEYLK